MAEAVNCAGRGTSPHRRGRGRPPGQRPGAGRPDSAFQGDDATERHLILAIFA
jgi:hypothetical protein